MADKPNFVLIPDEPKQEPARQRPAGLPVLQHVRAIAEKATALLAPRRPPVHAAPMPSRPRLVFGFDATASREPAWAVARPLTDALVRALPGELDVALAVHGGGRLHTFTEFTANPAALRDRAASVRCVSGQTRMLPILARALAAPGVRVVTYIGDVFEEQPARGRKLADEMGRRGIKLFVLHDVADWNARRDAELFLDLARRTGGCVLPFDAAAPARLQELLAAIAVYAVGGTALLEKQRATLPGAALLLKHLNQ
jgi:hypothetical protein